MKDFGYANGWTETPKEIVEAIEKGYRFKEVSHRPSGVDTVYECEELGLRYHVDSSG